MRIIRKSKKIKFKNSVIALGNFDGVHLGHKKILTSAAKFAKKNKVPSIAITFDPHPQQVVTPDRGLRLLTTLTERESLIEATGIDSLFVIQFSEGLRKLSSENFVKRYLVRKLKAKKVFVGYDYAFGEKRHGDVSHLRKLGKKFGFEVTVIRPVSHNGHIVKSKKIRELVSKGMFRKALEFLGHAYLISGEVVRGVGRGSDLGFPTANLNVDLNKLIPFPGVYAGYVLVSTKIYKCVVNIGLRPTFPGDGGAVEVHIIGFKGNIRRKRIHVALKSRFRDEMQFSDVENLKEQIKKDVKRASKLRLY